MKAPVEKEPPPPHAETPGEPEGKRGGLEADAQVASAASGGSRAKAHVLPRVRWHESWILRLAAVASFILFLGYGTSYYFALQSIGTIEKFAHDDEVEKSLGLHLTNIKKVHQLQQQLLVERMKPLLPAGVVEGDAKAAGTLDEARVRALLRTSGAVLSMEVAGAEIKTATAEDLAAAANGEAPGLHWLDRDRLLIGRYVVDFPRGPAYEAFKAAEDVRQRYQLIGAKLDDEIRPTLQRFTLMLMVASFLILGSVVVIYANRFKRRITDVIEGFHEWSERDSGFRFLDFHTGELKLITTQFNAMADEVEANRQRSLFLEKIASWQIIARKLAHEIKNPLTPIQMMVSQLKRRYKGDDEQFGKLLDNAQSIITEEVAGLRRMVDNFSNFARLPEPQPKPADVVQFTRNVIELQRMAFDKHEWFFTTKKPQLVCSVDEDLMRQVLINLTKNAAEACGDTPSKIGIDLDETSSEVLIRVKDDGPGIPEENQVRIFEAYFTTKHTGPSPGMGLGLAVCQKIVMDHDGKMTVASRPGETVFTIRLPKSNKRA